MAYYVIQQNDLIQDNILSTEFIIIDDEGIMPEICLNKIFNVTDDLDEIIKNQKLVDILLYENEYINNNYGGII
jgi:hypothetical protein